MHTSRLLGDSISLPTFKKATDVLPIEVKMKLLKDIEGPKHKKDAMTRFLES